jgi:tetratricopeptide (TPR) repeat protein
MRPIFDPMYLMRSTVEMRRKLVEGGGKKHALELVLALARLAEELDESGESDEAHALSREGVALLPLLAQTRARKLKKRAYDLADGLERFAERLRESHLEESVAARELSIAIYERWLMPDWAFELRDYREDLAADQLALGRYEDAIDTARASVAEWRALGDSVAYYVASVGCGCSVLSGALGGAGRWDEALDAADEAVAILRADGGGPDLADALIRRSAALVAKGRAAEAAADGEEAAAIREAVESSEA